MTFASSLFIFLLLAASQPVCCTLFALKIAPVEGRNVCSMLLTRCLAVIFGFKLLVFSQIYCVPEYNLNLTFFYSFFFLLKAKTRFFCFFWESLKIAKHGTFIFTSFLKIDNYGKTDLLFFVFLHRVTIRPLFGGHALLFGKK